MKYAHIENTKLLGWYDKDIHQNIPTPNIEVSDEQWQIALDNGHNKINNDGTSELFDFRTPQEVEEEDKLNQLREATKYLSDSDWVIVKITEMQLEGVDTTALMEKYKEELINRTFYRNLINQLEGDKI